MLGRKRKLDDFSAEIEAHLKLETERLQEQGLSYREARAAAHRAFGNLAKAQERFYESGRWVWWDHLWQDIRFGLLMLRKSPGFTAVAILTLALGIGANTAIFTLLDGLALRHLPVSHPEQLVHLGAAVPGDPDSVVSLPMFEELARNQKVFSGMFAWSGDGVFSVDASGQVSRADIWAVTGNFYSELSAVPLIGRLIEPADVRLSAASPAQLAVLGYDFWKRNYGGARDIIGQTLQIEAVPFTIIGVTRKGFKGMDADIGPDVTVPLTAEPLIAGDTNVQRHLQRRDVLWLDSAARLKPAITMGQARAEMESLWPAIRQDSMPLQPTAVDRSYFSSLQLEVEAYSTGASFLRREFAKPIYVLLAIAGVVLLLACVNLASLMLSRAAARSHEFAVRIALGASRAKLARQVLTESILISLAGTLAGFVFAMWASRAFGDFIIGQISIVPSSLNLSPDMRVLGFTAAMAIFTGVLFGLAPAWRATREDPNSALQQGGRAVGRGIGSLGKWLIVTQVGLSVVLLAGASLFIRTLEKLREVQPGFRIEGVLEAKLFRMPRGFENVDRVAYFHSLTERISALPGVSSAAMIHMGLGSDYEWKEEIQIHGQAGEPFPSDCGMVMPGFFRVEDIALIRGRAFEWTDGPKAPRVAIISEKLAQRLFRGGNAIGQHIDITTEPKWQDLEVVGIARDARIYDFRKPPQPMVYMPTTQYGDYMDYDSFLIRTGVSAAAILPAIRRTLDSFGRESVSSIRPLAGEVDRSMLPERITAILSAFFGALALLIAGIGLFGLMAYSVTQRTRELGIRFALGAQRGAVLRMTLRDALILTLIGVAIGLPCALAATRLIAHMLFGVTPYDPATLAIVTAALLIVGGLAGYIPGLRAMRVDPLVALRYEAGAEFVSQHTQARRFQRRN